VRTLLDLVLPAPCAGCGAGARSLCEECAAALAAAVPRRVRRDGSDLPRCYALAGYAGALRRALLTFKERGRHSLAGPLGDRLADVIAAGAMAAGGAGAGVVRGPLVLVAVPATAVARRRRYGDHMLRLARRAAARLRRAGWTVAVARPLRARPRPDSTGLSGADRRAAAAHAFEVIPGRVTAVRAAVAGGARLVLIDDVITTGSTLVAASARLRSAGLPVFMAAVLAATLQRPPVRPDPSTERDDASIKRGVTCGFPGVSVKVHQ
jgi:predicted amidophosphoribosyltransferase